MEQKTAIILHGTMGSPDGNWFPWLANQLRANDYDVYVPELPTPENQTKDDWCEALSNQAPIFDKNTTLIGHSCGATFLLHILETTKNTVANSVFVSPVMGTIDIPEYDHLNNTFINHEFDWDTITSKTAQSMVIHGDNDPYVPISHAEALSSKIGSPIEIIKDGGHLNSESGFNEFPFLLTHLLES